MKNYLFFDNKYRNWTIHLRDMENQIINIKTYLSMFHPRYSLVNAPIIYQTINLTALTYKKNKYYFIRNNQYVLSTDDFNENTTYYSSQIDYTQLKTHQYCYIDKDTYFLFNNNIPAGCLLLSMARNEGMSVYSHSDNAIQQDLKYYFLQPLGQATYYTISTNNRRLINQYKDDAATTYGLDYSFIFTFTNIRWVFSRNYEANLGINPVIVYNDIKGGSVTDDTNGTWTEQVSAVSGNYIPFGYIYVDGNNNECDELIADISISVQPEGVYVDTPDEMPFAYNLVLI